MYLLTSATFFWPKFSSLNPLYENVSELTWKFYVYLFSNINWNKSPTHVRNYIHFTEFFECFFLFYLFIFKGFLKSGDLLKTYYPKILTDYILSLFIATTVQHQLNSLAVKVKMKSFCNFKRDFHYFIYLRFIKFLRKPKVILWFIFL